MRNCIGWRELQKAKVYGVSSPVNKVDAGHSVKGFFWQEIETAFDSRVLTGAVINVTYIEPRNFLEDAKDVVLQHVQTALEKHGALKVNGVFNGRFVANNKHANKCVNTKNVELFQMSDLQEWYNRSVVDTILSSLEEFQERDSGWALQQILDLTINVNKYNPMHAGCYFKIPQNIRYKRATITIESGDNA
ncbi:uncharacterized protein LOC113464970, partial [Ceratina calcarata]|uniref:Uncharacterized protein LOC113464970 n=1 Tax=Ceratina calcarata TaxID=156304 RepID=A0AAJ7S8V4_9HYME